MRSHAGTDNEKKEKKKVGAKLISRSCLDKLTPTGDARTDIRIMVGQTEFLLDRPISGHPVAEDAQLTTAIWRWRADTYIVCEKADVCTIRIRVFVRTIFQAE